MKILIETGNNISGTEEMKEPLKATIANAFDSKFLFFGFKS